MNNNKSAEIKRSSKAENILIQINSKTKLGDLRKIAKGIRIDHELAMELWSSEEFLPRLLAILIMDKKLLSHDVLNKLDKDMQTHTFDQRNNLMDWLMANQLTSGLYKDDMVSKDCTPNYLPEFITIEVNKRNIN